MLRYRLKFTPDDNGTILVTSPDLPLATFGEDEASATAHAIDAAESILASKMDHREEIPVPQIAANDPSPTIGLPLQTDLKLELYIAMRGAGLTRADLQRRLGWKRESVDRLFRIDHNSRIEQLEEAFHALGRDIDIRVLEPVKVLVSA
jgi:antitoxin HicB